METTQEGGFMRIDREVDSRYEAAAIAKKLEMVREVQLIIVENIKGKVKDKLGISMTAGKHLSSIYNKLEERSQPMEVAITIGNHPDEEDYRGSYGSDRPCQLCSQGIFRKKIIRQALKRRNVTANRKTEHVNSTRKEQHIWVNLIWNL